MPFATADNAVTLPLQYNQNAANDANSVAHFIDSLFESGLGQVRHPATMTQGMLHAAQNDRSGYWLIDAIAQEAVLTSWWCIWERAIIDAAANPHRFQATDEALFHEIATYVQNNQLTMFVPNIQYVGAHGDANTPIYTLDGYTRSPLFLTGPELANPSGDAAMAKWGNIAEFLALFATGAHFVVINSQLDAPRAQPEFWTLFQSYKKWWRDAGPLNQYSTFAYFHSHYSGVGGGSNAGTGYVYPNTVTKDAAPAPCPFVCSLLVDVTAHRNPNSFFQLEGWPGMALKGFGKYGRHGQDFDVHKATKWNISTYGASPYSEKRGTAVFLAPHDWAPVPSSTCWVPYQGCKTLQGWYDTGLIRPTANIL